MATSNVRRATAFILLLATLLVLAVQPAPGKPAVQVLERLLGSKSQDERLKAPEVFRERRAEILGKPKSCLRLARAFLDAHGRVGVVGRHMSKAAAECIAGADAALERDDFVPRRRMLELCLETLALLRTWNEHEWVARMERVARVQIGEFCSAKHLGTLTPVDRQVVLSMAVHATIEGIEGFLPDKLRDAQTEAEDPSLKARLAGAMLDIADRYRRAGNTIEAYALTGEARTFLEGLASEDNAPPEAELELARILIRRSGSEPDEAGALLDEARAKCESVAKKAKRCGLLPLRLGQIRQREAELLELRGSDEDEKEIADAWKAALTLLGKALKSGEKSPAAATAYNECLWRVMKRTGGNARGKPVMVPMKTRCTYVRLAVPRSSSWSTVQSRDRHLVFHAVKIDKEVGDSLSVMVTRYRWETNYTMTGTDERIGGENIGGLARRDEADVREYFADVKARQPLRPTVLSKRIPKAQGYWVKGLTRDNDAYEWRSYFFRHAAAMSTYEVTIIASLGMLERNPYELREVLASFEMVK